MGKTYDELMAGLKPARRARVSARAAELLAAEGSLRELRMAHQLTQQGMARKLGVKQHSISRMEQRSDMLLSTLREYVGQLGGELVLTAHFPGHDPVRIVGIENGGSARKPVARTVKRKARS
jgi:DNA-binding XRE family transcriptional regulator